MKVLLVNQCFYPDVVSTAQHLTDLALALQERGHEVTVIASSRGYDNPERRFARRETWRGIHIRRVPCTGLGKGAKWRRAADFASYLVSCAVLLLFLPRQDLTIGMTSPPLVSFLAALFTRLKGGRFVFWVMDLNPDEAIAAGWLRPDSAVARLLAAMLRYSLRVADKIVVLDRFMKERIAAKGIASKSAPKNAPKSAIEAAIAVIPPWSHDDAAYYNHEGQLAFRAAHNLGDKYVVMYSGNHSPCHPLDTLLGAAAKLGEREDIAFCFIGGGSEFAKVKAFAAARQLANIVCLPYQPLEQLSASLSAADLHVVVMGEPFVGIVHPCKIYNILSIGARFLYVGPGESHVVDVLAQDGLRERACLVEHGDVEGIVRQLVEQVSDAARSHHRQLQPQRAQQAKALAHRYAQQTLMQELLAVLEGEPLTAERRDAAAA